MSSTLQWIIPRLFLGDVLDCVAELRHRVKSDTISFIFTPNPEQIELAERDKTFAQLLQQGNVFLPDGSGLVWAARRRGRPDIRRLTGRETLEAWLEQDAQMLPRTFLLGGQPEAAQTVAEMFDSGREHIRASVGFVDVTVPQSAEIDELWSQIESWKPEVIFVGFGAPRQEKWLVENRERLQRAGVRVAMVVGGSFDVISGQLATPPAWMERLNLEWLFRLMQEPSRWKRQVWLLRFVWRVLVER
jgi:N-acetylglucosaminyldiphosphoundecaprenol N-acetyl-beta-D-mannosaminyltransferase